MSTTGYDALYVRAACRRQTLRVACFPVRVRRLAISVANVVLLPLRRCRDSLLFDHPCSLTSTDLIYYCQFALCPGLNAQ
ncbi:MAG: hypothetical protein V7K53_13595 [Nostoc sp.]|uniref:hypothetical protein n=1 Tax=Nostoc sp. TaxID=1180 RepID=UPI002FF5B882